MKFKRVTEETEFKVISPDEYLKDKIFRYCDQMKERGQEFTLYDVHVEHVNDYWNLVSIIYGMWLARDSDFVPVEFSETSFDMVEYKAEG